MLTDDTPDERVTPGFHPDHFAILSATLGPTADSDLSLQMWILLLQGDKLVKTAFLNIELFIKNKPFPGDVAQADEGVDNVRTHISGDVTDTVTAYVRTIDSPIAKITYQPWSF